MSDETSVANLLYGTPQAPAPPDPVTTPLSELAQKIYGAPAAGAPAATQPLVHGLFDQFEMFRSDFARHGDALHDRLGISAEAREQDDRAFLHLTKNELGLDDHDIIRLHGLVVQGLTQVTPDPQDEPTESHAAKLHERNAEIRRVLRAQLGESEASDVMRRTEALIAKHPELQQLVNGAELATRAEPFLLLAQHVRDRHIR
jgi:hypothetical protein